MCSLYESLFAAATTPCRKLHRVARSVIVLDEAQTIPVELLRPTLMALKELVAHYGCTVVLCTATQPALEWREEFEIGIEKVHPIIQDVPALFTALSRVKVERLGRLTDDQLVDRLANEPAALCIVNTPTCGKTLRCADSRRRAAEWMLSPEHIHVRAQHRRDKLAEIRQRPQRSQTLPIAQHATDRGRRGRRFPCRLPRPCRLRCHCSGRWSLQPRRPTHAKWSGPSSAASISLTLKRRHRLVSSEPPRNLQARVDRPIIPIRWQRPRQSKPISASSIGHQKDQHQWDKPDVLGPLSDDFGHRELQLKFRTAAARYQIIREEQTSILVPYNDEARRIRDQLMRGDWADFLLFRKNAAGLPCRRARQLVEKTC